MPPRRGSDQEKVLAAIAHAESAAGDDAAFVDALNDHYHGRRPAPSRSLRAARSRTGPAAPCGGSRSFHIFEDPRYLANARALARRTAGGTRVLGGSPVKPGEFPDCVAIGSDDQWGCTGTLVAPNAVLTAGHCSEVATRIFLGNDVNKPGSVVRVKDAIRHPKYHQGRQHNDLLVLILKDRVERVPPRPLASSKAIDAATDGRVVGFGATEASGTHGYGTKRQVDVPIASPSCTGKVDGHDDAVSYGCDRRLELVAGRPLLARDSCNGDSGGPFYIAAADGAWFLAGVTSRATDSAVSNCGDGGVYARVDRYRAWIAGLRGVQLA